MSSSRTTVMRFLLPVYAAVVIGTMMSMMMLTGCHCHPVDQDSDSDSASVAGTNTTASVALPPPVPDLELEVLPNLKRGSLIISKIWRVSL